MTLASALVRLQDRLRNVDPGPVRHAYAFVFGLLASGQLEVEIARESPMLVGALMTLLRHATEEPYAHLIPRDVTAEWWVWLPRARRWGSDDGGSTELGAVIGALVAQAGSA